MQKKWAQITEIIASSIPVTEYKVWVDSLLVEFGVNYLKLCAPNNFMADFVRERYGACIESAIKAVCGDAYTCQIAVAARQSLKSIKCLHRQNDSLPKPRTQSQAKRTILSGNEIPFEGRKDLPDECFVQKEPIEIEKNLLGKGLSFMPHDILPSDNSFAVTKHSTAARVGVLPSPRPLPVVQASLPVSVPNKNMAQLRNWRFSFEDFVVGSSNELAFAASKNMCSEYMQANTLYLNSSPGLGKTHLLQAVGHSLSASCNRTQSKVEYLTAEEFTSQFLFSLQGRTVDQFKSRYRNLDLLLLEDVHFLQSKEQTQMELLATIKAIHDRGGKVVLTSSFSVRELKFINEQLVSRICSGFISPIDKPDFETRCRILRHKAQKQQVVLSAEVEALLAEHIHGDVRQIESCLQNMILKAQLYKTGITEQMAWDVIGNYAAQCPDMSLEAIIQKVCKFFSLNHEQLVSTKRKKDYVLARNAAFYLARKHTDLSLEAIGQRFNKKHSTVLKGITNLEREISRQTPEGRQIAHTLSIIEKSSRVN